MALLGPATLLWTARAPLPEPRSALLTAVIQGKLLAAGGTFWQDGVKRWSRRCDWFDPSTGRWETCPALPSARADSASVQAGNDVFFLGGTSDGRVLDDVVVFRQGHWEDVPAMRLPSPRSYAKAAVSGGRLFLFGGLTQTGDVASAAAQIWVWDLGSPRPSWRQAGEMPPPAFALSGFAADERQAWFAGGAFQDATGIHNRREVWTFEFQTGQWRLAASLPEANRASSALPNQKGLLILGGYDSGFSRGVLSISTAGRLSAVGEIPLGLADASMHWIGDRLYITGGESGMKIRAGQTWEGHFAPSSNQR